MTGLLERLLALWLEPLDARADPEAAFREVYADPVSVNGETVPVSRLVERAHALQHAFADLAIDLVEQVATPDRLVIAFHMRGRHVGPLSTPLGSVAPTGRTVAVRTIDVLSVDDGRVGAIWVVSDELGMLARLDAVRLV